MIKLVDQLSPMGNFAVATATDIVCSDNERLQDKIDNGTLGGDTSIITTEAEYLALPEEQKLNNSYYLYDIGVHYKNGVAYSRKKPIQLTMEEYKALGEVDPDQEYIISADAEGILLEASDIGYSNAVSNLPCTTVQGAIDDNSGRIAEVETKLGEKVDYKVVVEDGSRYVEDVVTQDINTWLPNDNSSIVINLKKTNGINYLNFQLLCNKKDSKNWSCIVNGAANELWKIRYIDGVRYIDELATMDKVESKYSEENVLTPTDWNTLNTKARYYFSGGTPMTNSPEEVPFGLLEVINVGLYCLIQRYFAFDGKLYIRRWSGNDWNEWYRFDGIAI